MFILCECISLSGAGRLFSTTGAGQLPAWDALQTAERGAKEVVRHAPRSPIHHHRARSEHKFTISAHQSLKQLLTFRASAIDSSTGWTNLAEVWALSETLASDPRRKTWHKSPQSCQQTQKKMQMSNYVWRDTWMDVCASKLDRALTSSCAAKSAPHLGRRRPEEYFKPSRKSSQSREDYAARPWDILTCETCIFSF